MVNIKIGNSVEAIGAEAFFRCGLTDIAIPASVNNIGRNAFSFCSNLTRVDIHAGVTAIGEGAFEYCSALTSIEIPQGIAVIEKGTFYGCKALRSVTIPASVTSICDGAFYDCTNLWHVLYKGTEAQWNEISIDSYGLDYLTNATRHNNCTGQEITNLEEKQCSLCGEKDENSIPKVVSVLLIAGGAALAISIIALSVRSKKR